MKKLTALLLTFGLFLALAVPALAATAETVEQTIRALGIIAGDEKGRLNLDDYVTRAQFAKMMVTASALRDSVGQPGGSAPFSDVRATHWSAEYIRAAVQSGWVVGYVDGTFRPDGYIKTEEAATAVLRMLGYTQADLSGVYPAPQLAKYRSLGLSNGVAAGQGQQMTRRDCMYLFYNLMTAQTATGLVYATTIGYTVTASGEINYSSLVETQLKGPFIAQSASLSSIVPFAPAEVYRAGTLTSSRTLELYDVVYYHEGLRTVWVYNDRAAGLYTAAAPTADSPSSVTVGGVVYTVSTTTAAYKLSTMGPFSVGDTVTLLLGRGGEVVDVLDREAGNAVYYGVATGKREISFELPSGGMQTREMAVVFCTDGTEREFPIDAGYLAPGLAVRVSVEDGRATIERAASNPFSGTVNSDGTAIGSVKFANNAQILDSDRQGNATALFPARLAGYRLDSANIRFFALNEKGEVSHLILNDATGDLATFGILTSAAEKETKIESKTDDNYSYAYSSTYSYIINGAPGVYTADKPLGFREGASALQFDGMELTAVNPLAGYSITELSQTHAFSDSRRLALGAGLQVYLFDKGAYTLKVLDDVRDLDKYRLTGYIDSHAVGGHIRVIIAQPRTT